MDPSEANIHQALQNARPAEAWDLLDHTPATEAIPLVVLEAKAAEYAQARRGRQEELHRAGLTITKSGQVVIDDTGGGGAVRAAEQSTVEVTRDNRQVYYQGLHVKLPSSYGGREYFRTITDAEFLLTDPATGEVVFSFPLVALNVRGRFVASYAIRGVQLSWPSKQWERKHAEYAELFRRREDDLPEVFRR